MTLIILGLVLALTAFAYLAKAPAQLLLVDGEMLEIELGGHGRPRRAHQQLLIAALCDLGISQIVAGDHTLVGMGAVIGKTFRSGATLIGVPAAEMQTIRIVT